MRRALFLLVLGVLPAAAWVRAHSDLLPAAPAAEAKAEARAAWTAVVHCELHRRTRSAGQPGLEAAPSAAAQGLLSSLCALLLYGPQGRLLIELVARGELVDGGKTLHGDLLVRAAHPALLQEADLWEAVRSVRRAGVSRIRGRVLWTPSLRWPQVPATEAAELHFEPLEDRLGLAGVSVEPPAAGRPAAHARLDLLARESQPLFLLLRREPGLLRPTLADAATLGRLLARLEPPDAGWLDPRYPLLSAGEVLGLWRRALAHPRIGEELCAILQARVLGTPGARPLRGWIVCEAQRCELVGRLELEGHGELLVALQAAGTDSTERLVERIEALVLEEAEDTGRIYAHAPRARRNFFASGPVQNSSTSPPFEGTRSR